jgi:hypothetical protein
LPENAVDRQSWRHAAVIVAGFEAVAVALWLVSASIHIVDWPAAGPARVAFFQSRTALVVLAVAALGASAVAIARSRGRARVAAAAARLSILWLWSLPYWPWLPERLPLLMILGGPLRWIVAAVAVGGAVAATSPPLTLQPWIARADARRARALVFVASMVLYGALGLLNARVVGPGGDEPHYLIISQSLLADGDLKIENNHQRREFRAFWGGDLRPDYMKRGIDGEIYSIHAPGLPILLLPVYAIAGYPGTVLALSALAALTAVAIFDLAVAVAGLGAAIVTWAAVCLTVPFVPHSWLIFPEMPGALIVAWSALWLFRPPDNSSWRWICRGAALAALPWLHTKFVIFLAIMSAALAWRARARASVLIPFLGPIVVSTAAWFAFFYAYYGSFNPEAPYGDYPAINVLFRNIPRGLLGLMFDQKFGLFFYSPIYLVALAGGWLMLRHPEMRFTGAVLVLAIAAHVGSTTRLYMWWGGTSAPARFLVPILPCLAPMVALAAAGLRGRAGRALFGVLLLASLAIAAIGVGLPERLFLFSDSRGYSRLLETVQSGAPFTFSLPTFTYEDWRAPIWQLLPWLVAAALAFGVMAAAARVLRPDLFWLNALALAVLVVSANLLAGRPDPGARDELARRGTLDLLWQYDGRLRPFEYRSLRKIDETRVRELAHITFGRYPVPAFALPAGSYEARVWFGGSLQRQGEIAVASAQRVTFARTSGTLENPAKVAFDLPVAVGRLTVTVADQQLATSVARTEIVPTVLTSRSAREASPARRIEGIPGRTGAYVIYVDGNAFPEGGVFWTRGTERAAVLMAPGGFSRARLTLHLGPHGGDVKIGLPGDEKTVRVEAGGTAEVLVDVPAGHRLIPVTIQSPTSFRPSDVDPRSDDTRTLGVQVRVDVE